MKVPVTSILLAFAVLAGSTSVPLPDSGFVQPNLGSAQYQAQDNKGQYSYGYAITDGTHKSEYRKPDGQVVGTYGYVSPTGERVEVSYTAGKDGFKVISGTIPQEEKPTLEIVVVPKPPKLGVVTTQSQQTQASKQTIFAQQSQSSSSSSSHAAHAHPVTFTHVRPYFIRAK